MKRNQLIIFGGIFGVVLAALLLGYLLLFQQDYVVLYDNIREQDSAAIIAELDGEGIPFELAAKGTRVMVPDDEADRARVLVAGAGIPMGGVVGFELFNETDMGLTDFAQKVNYQRALQGELARTIMMMDGIAFARVHLSLPERTVFRAESQEPKAAVTVQAKPGRRVGDERVAGIQQLVSSSVTRLAASDVAVLDEVGKLVSVPTLAVSEESEALDERSALEEYYRARATKAAKQVLPNLTFRVRVTAIDSRSSAVERPSGNKAARNFSLNIALRTEIGIAREDQEDLREVVENAVDLKPENGDLLRFEVAPFEPASGPMPGRPPAASVGDTELPRPLATATPSYWDLLAIFGSIWFWLGVLALLAIAPPLLRRRSRLSEEERQSFAEILGEQLSNRQESQRD